jgi:pyruvate-ferredoxin/flavodoxin oxidoreductase
MFNKKTTKTFPYPGKRIATDGNGAVIFCEREASDAAGAYPITPSTQMGEYWAEETAKGHINAFGKPLVFIEPESEHAAAAVTAGLSMTGLRAVNFSSAQGVAFMHESLYAAAGKHLPYVLNIGCRAITKASLNVHCAHDDYHCIDDTGFIQVMGNSAQEAADLNLIARKTAELALLPAAVAQDGFLTTHLIEAVNIPERELIADYLGSPEDLIDTPTPAQKIIFGDKRRRIPPIWDVDNPVASGTVQNQDAYMQAVAAQRPYFHRHVPELIEQCMDEYYELTGRRYNRVSTYKIEDADYIILGQGSMIVQAQAVADYLRETRKLKVGVVNITLFRPFPGDLLGKILKAKKAVTILERTDQPLAEDLPLMRETRAALSKCLENGRADKDKLPYPDYAVYGQIKDLPSLYSGAFGLGSRDMQPEAIVGAVENMLPDGKQRKFFYLSIDFIHASADSPKQELYQQELLEAYPDIGDLSVRGSENPNLMPEGAITVRMHSVGGWGAITTGKNLAMTLYDLLDYHIKANPKYGSEKKGQPTTYYLSAAPEPIRVNCEYHYVDVVLSPDPNVFEHSNPLYGLKKGGVFIIQSTLNAEELWASLPITAQRFIIDKEIRVFFIDGFKIAREEAGNPDLQLRMQGIAFQGAFFAASPVMQSAGLNEKTLFKAIEEQLESKFGSKGRRVVEDNLRVVRRGFDEIHEITNKAISQITAPMMRRDLHLPVMLKQQPAGHMKSSDIHRFWEQTGNFYINGKGSDNLADPFIGMSLLPASTGVFRDMTQIRFDYPVWNAENCTACGDCYTLCPDSAIPGLVNSVSEIFNTAISQVEIGGQPTRFLRRASRDVEKKLRGLIDQAGEAGNVNQLLDQAVLEVLADSELAEGEKATLEKEFGLFMEKIGTFKFSATKPYYFNKEKKAKNSGGLFSLTINPYTCKGCMECVTTCEDDALVAVPQSEENIKTQRRDWDFWLNLPTTSSDYIRIDDLDEKIGALETLLLDKRNYDSMVCGDGACLGCGEKTAIHLFTGTVTALMQPRIKKHLAHIDDLIARLEQHIRLKLAANVDLSNVGAIHTIVEANHDKDLTLTKLAEGLESKHNPVDAEWLDWVTNLLDDLKQLKWRYTDGITNNGRADLGFINATGCTSVWGATFPYNPYPFPWTSHLFQDSPSMAMGIFEGHMAKMADGFKAIRMAELELAGKYKPEKDKDFFTYFGWKDFTEEEFHLCPPVVSVGGDGAMYDIGFQNLSRMMMSGMPIKVLILDTQVYSNTGGQACTSGFISQVSDMAPYAKQWRGKEETRKEISLIAMGHRTTYVLQSTVAHVTHLLEGYIDGLNSNRPALFNIYAVCPPEHGIADDMAELQSKLAVESRAYPLLKYDPDAGDTIAECIDLEGNPAMDDDWPSYSLSYLNDKGTEEKLEVPLTFADFAVTEGRFGKHFRKAPQDAWNDNMLPLSEFLHLDEDEREGRFPYIWTVDKKNHLTRVLVSQEIVLSCEERRAFWRMLKSAAGLDGKVDVDALIQQAKADMAQKISLGLLSLAGGGGGDLLGSLTAGNGGNGATNNAASSASADYEPVWVETPECTACDECININPKIFAYNDEKKAYIVDPKGGPYKDIVKAAEKCTASCLHPGTPFNMTEKDVEKLIKRAEKYQ